MTESNIRYTDSGLNDKIKQFLQSFKINRRYIYVDSIDSMMAQNRTFLEVDYFHLSQQSDLEKIFADTPDYFLEVFCRAIREILQTRYPKYAELITDEITVRISNHPNKKTLRQLNSKESGKFVSIKAMMIRMSAVESIPKVAVYRIDPLIRN